MKLIIATILIVGLIFIQSGVSAATPDLRHIVSDTPALVQEAAVRALIERSVGKDMSQKFTVEVSHTMPFRSFEVTKSADDTICIVGSDGVSVAKGFHHYIKFHLYMDVDWTNTRVELPPATSLPNVTLFSKSASDFIYYQNVCTWSYSFAWWSWSLWQRHIDWMAMMGITLTIAPVQEHIWYGLFVDIGLTADEIDEHFAGPAFQAWQRMGNIRGWAGPLPPSYRRMQKVLQQRILEAERNLGMSVALPAFAGHVPIAMPRLYPNVTFTPVERWNHFPNVYCCDLFLDPNEPLFQEIGALFLQHVIKAYGSDHIYFCDPFNEVQPRSAEAAYLNATAFHIYASMRRMDDTAVWLLQGWMFVKNIFWTDELIKAFLTAVPQGQLLVLDLQSEQFPQYERTHSFYGQPFIWCMLHNFGDTLGMHGSADVVNTRISAARHIANSSMIGAGITPEGINQNYVMYALALERAWLSEDLDLQKWFDDYADARYGVLSSHLRKAWQLLRTSVYSYRGLNKIRGKYTITRRPATNLTPWSWYNVSLVYAAWQEFLDAANASIPQRNYAVYEHDLVDMTRQFLQVTADRLYVNLMAAYNQRQLQRFSYIAEKMLRVFDDLEEMLATNVNFLLGPWLESAKRMARRPLERQLYEMNARNQITAWGPDGQILDYATKQWSGIVRDYYRPRWVLFLMLMQRSLQDNTKFDGAQFKKTVSNEIENPFSVRTTKYPTDPTGSTLQVARRIFKDWSSIFNSADLKKNLQLHVAVL